MTKQLKQEIKKPPIQVLIKFCFDVVSSPKYPKERSNKAGKLRDEWLILQNLPESSPKEREGKRKQLQLLYDRLTAFRRETE
ncbi:MAG TPA: hypothetical protein VI386_17380 [Candidatus Sulfotelmatobacter sp.]